MTSLRRKWVFLVADKAVTNETEEKRYGLLICCHVGVYLVDSLCVFFRDCGGNGNKEWRKWDN
jgi:hypothetical protein